MSVSIGDTAPSFTLPKDGGGTLSLSNFLGKKVLIFFYPHDRTPGCTIEACTFRDAKEEFEDRNIAIIGISRDSIESHEDFKERYDLNFDLLSDEEEEVCTAYGVLNKEPFLGIKLFELERSSFLIDENGKIEQIWKNVNSLNHVKKLLREL